MVLLDSVMGKARQGLPSYRDISRVKIKRAQSTGQRGHLEACSSYPREPLAAATPGLISLSDYISSCSVTCKPDFENRVPNDLPIRC